MSIQATKTEGVGFRKSMTTKACLYRSGQLLVEISTDCENLFHGLRGRALIVISDGSGNAIGVTEELRCATRGGLLDPATPSAGKDIFSLQFPREIGERAVGLDIRQTDADDLRGKVERILNLSNTVQGIPSSSVPISPGGTQVNGFTNATSIMIQHSQINMVGRDLTLHENN